VVEAVTFSKDVTFANLKMDGQVIDVNCTKDNYLEKNNRNAT
jgi:hypothetical protein